MRITQPFNYLATTTTLAALNLSGTHSELITKHLHRVGITRNRLPNGRRIRLWSQGDDWISNQVFWRGWSGHEPETVPLFFRLAQKAQVTFDVGAHIGYFTLLAAPANSKGRVYTFEPMPKIFERLQHNISINGIRHRVQTTQTAVGAADGEAEFFYQEGGLPSSSSLSHEFMDVTCSLKESSF